MSGNRRVERAETEGTFERGWRASESLHVGMHREAGGAGSLVLVICAEWRQPGGNRDGGGGGEPVAYLDNMHILPARSAPISLGSPTGGASGPALFSYRSLENFYFKFGLRYNQIYADAPWLPYLGFSWDLSESLRIDLLAPEYFEISYWPEASTSFAFGAEVSGAQYRVHSTLFTGKQEANAQVQEVVAYLGATHRFSDQVSLQIRGGVVLAGEYDLTTGAESATSPFNRFDPAEGALDQGFYADITFGLNW